MLGNFEVGQALRHALAVWYNVAALTVSNGDLTTAVVHAMHLSVRSI